jgi:hypothetical protein
MAVEDESRAREAAAIVAAAEKSAAREREWAETAAAERADLSSKRAEVRSIHWSPYDRVGVMNAVP